MKSIRQYSRSLIVLCSMLLVASCNFNAVNGEGSIETETRQLGSFTGISVHVPCKATVIIDNATTPYVTINTYQNILPLITTKVSGDKLVVRSTESISVDKDLIVEIHVNSLTNLSVTGAATAWVKGVVIGNEFELDLTGASTIVIEKLAVNTFIADLTGASKLSIMGGNVSDAEYDVAGAGQIAAYDLISKTAKVDISGAGNIKLQATDRLDADVSGAGNVYYKGTPKVNANTTGAGNVTSGE